MKWSLKVIADNYANFQGRVRRKTYWIFFAFNLFLTYIIAYMASILVECTEHIYFMYLPIIYIIAVTIPSIAIGVRRMHDVGKSGWYLCIPIYSFILAVSAGDTGPNNYGEDPKKEPAENLKDYFTDFFKLHKQQS